MRKLFAAILGVATLTVTGASLVIGDATSAFADSSPYELVCPGTPVGTVVINDVVTSATISPASPTAGQAITITNYQTSLTLVSQVAVAANAIQTSIQGSAVATLDATGATPSTVTVPTVQINTPIPNGGTNGVPLKLPASPESVSGFTASGSTVTISQDKSAQLQLLLNGSPINTTCTAYPNDSNKTGLLTSGTSVSGSPVSPQIATTSAGSSSPATSTPTTAATTATTAATTPTTVAPSTSASNSALPTTGAGPGLWLLALAGAVLVGGSLFFVVGAEARRRLLLRGAHRVKRRSP